MRNKIEVTFEGNHVRVIADGDKDYHFQNRLWQEVTAECEKHQCFKVLGISNTTTPLEAVEGYDTARIFRQLNIDSRYRLAWVETNAESRNMTEFIATVLANRGLPGRLFDTEEEATEWLLVSE
jgi:Cu/Ag efflux pump CusA